MGMQNLSSPGLTGRSSKHGILLFAHSPLALWVLDAPLFAGHDNSYRGSQLNTSPERSSGVSEGPNAPLSCASIVCGVQPSALCKVLIGRVWLNKNSSLLRTEKICPEIPSARSEAR